MITLGQDIAADFESGTSREWLETNGLGGYASGTISGANARRYHGQLIAARNPPVGRMLLLSKFEETLVIDDERYELSTNQYAGSVHPEGYIHLAGFRLDPFPIWTYKVGEIEIEKKIFMVNGENTTVASWRIKRRKKNDRRVVMLELRPLISFRDHHHLLHEESDFSGGIGRGDRYVSFTPLADGPTLYLGHDAASIEPTGYWYRNFEYAIERERGFDFTEDLFQPCVLSFDLARTATVVASTGIRQAIDAAGYENAEIKRRETLIANAGASDEFSKQLVLAADQFVVKRGTGHTVIAGYHWFSDWGRDTMIALPGLALATNRADIAKSILAEFSNHISEGMLPNRFPDAGEEPEYNTIDATLWYFEAIRAYAEKTRDHKFVREDLYDKLVDIIAWHIRGTRYGIGIDLDGLLHAGEPGVQLTWMDAKIGSWVVTPRTGKPVEIQALWYNALCIMADFATKFGDKQGARRYREMAATARVSFNDQFWNDEENCLYDVVENGSKDGSVRPNQLFAVSVPHSILDADRARAVVDKCEAELLTPVGLRSLSPNDPRYVPVYQGSPEARDAAYHQGTVWAWLIGPFIDAYRKTHASNPRSKKQISKFLTGFKAHLSEAMVGEVAEIFDADPPHTVRGAAAQAWSVAELLRVTLTDPQ